MMLLTLTACGSVRVFELPKVQQNLQMTLQASDGIAQKSQADFTEKKLLVDNLEKSNAPLFKQNESEIRHRLRAMDDALQDIINEKRNMSEASGEIASLSYNRPTVRSDEREFPKVDDAVKRFETAAAGLNSSAVDYSRESNSMADLIAQKKLYYNFDVAEFQKRVQRNTGVAQENIKVMERELKRSEAVVQSGRPESRRAQEEIYSEMRASANEYRERAGRFAELNREINAAVMGAAKISTLDPHWQDVQRRVAEFDDVVRQLADINEKFLSKVESFRNPSRRIK